MLKRFYEGQHEADVSMSTYVVYSNRVNYSSTNYSTTAVSLKVTSLVCIVPVPVSIFRYVVKREASRESIRLLLLL